MWIGKKSTQTPPRREPTLGATPAAASGIKTFFARSSQPKQVKPSVSLTHRFLRLQFSGAGGVLGAGARIEFYETLELLLSNNVMLSTALREIYKIESKNGKNTKSLRAIVIFECMSALDSGRNLSDALARWVPDQEAQLIRAGERSGELAGALTDAVRIIEAKRAIFGAILGGTAYPLLLSGISVVLLNLISTKMVPQFIKILKPNQWSPPAMALRAIADYVNHYGLVTVVGLIVFFIWMFWSMPNMSRAHIRRVLDKIPPWSLYRMLHGATFLLNVAVMLRAGVKVHDVLTLMSDAGSPWMKVRIQAALNGINQGMNLGEALHRSGYEFPDARAVQFLRILANQEGFENKLTRFGERWMEASVADVKKASAMMTSFSILLIGALLMLVIAGMMSIQQSIT